MRSLFCAPTVAITAALVVLGRTGPVDAFSTARAPGTSDSLRWSTETIELVIQSDGSDDIDDGSDLDAVRRAFAQWNTLSCIGIEFVDGGVSASRADARDGVNRITWIESDWRAQFGFAIAVAARYTDSGQTRWAEADVLLNGTVEADGSPRRWATDGRRDAHDIQSAVAHELGHVLGLNHSADPTATMYSSSIEGQITGRTLADDDVLGGCFLYPRSASICTRDEECPTLIDHIGTDSDTTRCISGGCASAPGSYGASCFDDDQCESDICQRDPVGSATDPGFCTIACGIDSECPLGDACLDGPLGRRCYLGRDDCWDLDEVLASAAAQCPGNVNNVCVRDLDGRFRCQLLCESDENCRTVPGAVCDGGVPDPFMTGNEVVGFCRIPGSALDGDPCSSGLECASLRCTTDGDGISRCGNGGPGSGDPAPDDPDDPEDPPGSGGGGEGAGQLPGGGGGDGEGLAPVTSDGDGGCAALSPAPLFFMRRRRRMDRTGKLGHER
ncbi:MAG: matrixin family metalloprotease [Myxococcota bacterium]